MLQVEGAVVRFGDFGALDDVDLSVGPEETVAVLGPSGCGKDHAVARDRGFATARRRPDHLGR